MFSFSVDIDANRLLSRYEDRLERAQAFLDNEVLRQSRPYVPFRTGMLVNTAIVERPGKLVYVQPYARRQYYGQDFNFTLTHHPKAGPKWVDRAKAVHFPAWLEGVERILKGGNQ